MANADFQKQSNSSGLGGFDNASYRTAPQDDAKRSLTPAQQKAAALEKALPGALKNRAAALALSAVLIAGAVLGLGGAKLNAKYRETAQIYTMGTAEDRGGILRDQLTQRFDCAANVLTTAGHTDGADANYIAAAQTALDACRAALDAGDISDLYAANVTLDSAIDQLYANLQSLSATPLAMGAVQDQYSKFNQAMNLIANLHYNAAAQDYNDMAEGFPAKLIGSLWNIREVELFA